MNNFLKVVLAIKLSLIWTISIKKSQPPSEIDMNVFTLEAVN